MEIQNTEHINSYPTPHVILIVKCYKTLKRKWEL